MTTAFEWSPHNNKWRKSNRWVLATERASRLTKVCNRILALVEDPATDADTIESLLVTYSELEERLEKIQERNFYGNVKYERRKNKAKKKQQVKDILKFPPQQQ